MTYLIVATGDVGESPLHAREAQTSNRIPNTYQILEARSKDPRVRERCSPTTLTFPSIGAYSIERPFLIRLVWHIPCYDQKGQLPVVSK